MRQAHLDVLRQEAAQYNSRLGVLEEDNMDAAEGCQDAAGEEDVLHTSHALSLSTIPIIIPPDFGSLDCLARHSTTLSTHRSVCSEQSSRKC